MSIVTVVGNPREGSRTLAVAARAAEELARQLEQPPSGHVVDLAALAPNLLARDPGPDVETALKLALDADVLVVASPTYKGTYTGLLKVFLDRFPHQALAGKAALPLLVMGDPKHSLAVEVHLRPLLVELGAFVPTPGLAVLESVLPRDLLPGDLGAEGASAPELDELLDRWAGQVAPLLAYRRELPA
ncbi:hypothetical protein Pth03_73220 [Planotetraspora thailandica]|uniref:NADPH-dependent FMN reductase-like domain-containing protein n=1 Tax=Planotetraspora thailandica TaxID=487172 RepID=A0A8J4DE55_9ACTN|nr:NAD(P)H-dependent oxidoreductase [Planotetraspora thailandica]GII58933.1 hypothetical protein Pth03_73220 [Planotetraspora thailandica]